MNIYDLGTLRRRKRLDFPDDIPTKRTQAMAFTYDSKGIAVLSQEPDAFVAVYYFDKAETTITCRVSVGTKKKLIARHVSCNLNDTGLLAVSGDYTLKILSRQENMFTPIGTMTGKEYKFTSLIWLTSEVLIAGTANSELVFIEGGDLKIIYPAELIETIDLGRTKEE